MALAAAIAAGTVVVLTGGDGGSDSAAGGPLGAFAPSGAPSVGRSAESAAGAESPSKSAEATPAPTASSSQPASQDRISAEIDERRAAAASGDPITRSTPTGTAQGNEEFGQSVLASGDVTVFKPRRDRGSLTLSLSITNSGKERAFYQVEVRITGPGGFDATVRVDTGAVALYPGTSWPTELTVKDSGKPLPDNPVVSIVKNNKRELQS
ncbi:hypothetical protein OG735_22670 [Streptomyces sp. NBC_01210]|uniref:hypothetical protein n=1 Tax=Streptomyces sp. NBC_01210 TaxID=2903774 RepID=UPI002E152849|nr:hypothetical protein OG735_22670 [Streptomyces sp. NBC_01210]